MNTPTIQRLRNMRLVIQRKIAETTHRVTNNGERGAVNDLRADDEALKLAIHYLGTRK